MNPKRTIGRAETVETDRMPVSVVKRLSGYLEQVRALRQEGTAWVSSASLGEALGLTSSTVRQDLTHVEYRGIGKRGYSTEGLDAALTRRLGADQEFRCLVVGAGNMGRAMVLHEDFAFQGFTIVGIFDRDPALIGLQVGRLTIRTMGELAREAIRTRALLGIVAVPVGAAQSVADALVAAGVRGLLNVTASHLVTPADVPVVNVRILGSLRELGYALITRSAPGSVGLPSVGISLKGKKL